MKPSNCNILVCINSHSKTAALLSAGNRLASEINRPWCALHIESPSQTPIDKKSQERILRFLTQAEQMGAKVIKKEASDIEKGIINFINENPSIKNVIIGRNEKDSLWPQFHSSLAERLLRTLKNNQQVQIVPLTKSNKSKVWFKKKSLSKTPWMQGLWYASLSVITACLITEFLRLFMKPYLFELNNYNIAIIFLTASAIVAGRFGVIPGIIAAILSFFTVNLLYLKTSTNINLLSLPDFINLLVFLCSSILLSLFCSYTHKHAETAKKRERRMQALYYVSRGLVHASTLMEAILILHRELENILETKVAFFLKKDPKDKNLSLIYPNDVSLDEHAQNALHTCLEKNITTGCGAPEYYFSRWRFEPMGTSSYIKGALGVHIPDNMKLDASFGHLLHSIANQTMQAFERIEVTSSMENARVSEEREKLRATLLSSVSHDLKTPLASIIGSLSVYHTMHNLPTEKKLILTQNAFDEAQRLDSFISNILDMTQLENGAIKFREDWEDPESLILRVKKRLAPKLKKHNVIISSPDYNAEIKIDPGMTEQVIQNLLDNASKYAPEGTNIEIGFGFIDDHFRISIRDHGPGIPDHMKERIFDKYERLNKEDTKVAGTGLGLAICRAIMKAQNGNINVENHLEGGAVFTITFAEAKIMDKDKVIL